MIPVRSNADALDFALDAQALATREILGEGRGGDQALALAENAHEFADALIGRILQHAGPADRPACRRGCTACCHLHASVTAPEGVRIAEFVRDHFNPAERAALDQRIEAHVAATAGMTAEERRQARLPCPLLVGGDCSVHPVRPLSCRGWNSLERSICDADLANPSARTEARLNLDQFLAAGRVSEGLRMGCAREGLDDRMLDLPRALQIALEDGSANDEWVGGGQEFAPAVDSVVFPSPGFRADDEARRLLRKAAAARLGWAAESDQD